MCVYIEKYISQIQWNLFCSTNLNMDKDKESSMSRLFTPWKEIENNYRKVGGAEEFTMKPRFYVITNLDVNNQDAPKLDGLACNFILGTPDKIRYPLLLDGLIEILNVTHVTCGMAASKMTFLGLCATQYCFTICWRYNLVNKFYFCFSTHNFIIVYIIFDRGIFLLRRNIILKLLIDICLFAIVHSKGSNYASFNINIRRSLYLVSCGFRLLQLLPPSTPYIERLSSGEHLAAGPLLLYSLVWGSRTNHKTFARWLKDCLIKQGMYTQHTDKLLKTTWDAISNLKYDVITAKNCIISLTPDIKKGNDPGHNLVNAS